MCENRDFKGVWISKDIWLNDELTLLEKIIYIEIDSLDNENHCTASNRYFADFCNCSESKVTKAITKLQELNMIEVLSFDGRHRKLRVVKNATQPRKKYEADSQKVRANNIDNKKENNKTKEDKPENPNPSTIVELYNTTCVSLPKVRSITDKRKKAIQALFKKGYTVDDFTEVFTIANNSDFLAGKNDRGWKADLDFLLREDKFVKTLEGGYGSYKKSRDGLSGTSDSHERKEDMHRRIENGELQKF